MLQGRLKKCFYICNFIDADQRLFGNSVNNLLILVPFS